MSDTKPKDPAIVAQELKKILDLSGKDCVTLTWDKVYSLSSRKKWTDKAHEETRNEVYNLGSILGYGPDVVVIAKNENFSPPTILEN